MRLLELLHLHHRVWLLVLLQHKIRLRLLLHHHLRRTAKSTSYSERLLLRVYPEQRTIGLLQGLHLGNRRHLLHMLLWLDPPTSSPLLL